MSNALKVLRQSKGVNLQLGPSPGVQKAMNRVNAAKQELDPEHFQRQQQKKGKAKVKVARN